MNRTETDSMEARIAARGEQIILNLKKSLGRTRFRYAVAERKGEEGRATYSIYADYSDEIRHTVESIADFSDSRETAEAFCRLLSSMLATPLSLHALYEDSMTP